MKAPRPPRRETLQRGVVILPSAFTLGNLFFGVFSMVATARGDLGYASWFIVIAGTLDMLDGRIARFTRTGTKFGAELDSLVDAISFGVAPAAIMYQLYFSDTHWSWTLSYVYVTAVVVRLARFNIEQSGGAIRYFHGLPSPAAGMLLASFYPFSRTPFFATYLSMLPWPQITGIAVVLLGVLMVSHVPYAKVPRIGLGSTRGLLTTAFVLGCIFAAVSVPEYFFFVFLLVYVMWGLLRSALMGLMDRLPGVDPLLDEEDDPANAFAEARVLDYGPLGPRAPSGSQPDDEDSLEEHA
ncbi:MAG: CDP-diacylglycerol--serine O-phosphatidyltransferase [Gemmatimonadetes bacterium]|nr:CDP-diacylglycerol--serine O-phosphatidyltransferase [Gemmatimonadota bacterium]